MLYELSSLYGNNWLNFNFFLFLFLLDLDFHWFARLWNWKELKSSKYRIIKNFHSFSQLLSLIYSSSFESFFQRRKEYQFQFICFSEDVVYNPILFSFRFHLYDEIRIQCVCSSSVAISKLISFAHSSNQIARL